MHQGELVLSVVSHGQLQLLLRLLGDLRANVGTPFRLIITENIGDGPEVCGEDYPFPIKVLRNATPRGFGANHNSALQHAGDGVFCILNPDIRLNTDPFPVLLRALADRRIGFVSPLVLGPDMSQEDHARDFPSIFALLKKALGPASLTSRPHGEPIYFPDWIAGMFILTRSSTMRELGGFDERYFLYYEDVDLCARLRDRGLEVAVCANAAVIHEARRQSRKNVRYALWHLRSALRFLASRPLIAMGIRLNRHSSMHS